MDNMKLYEQFRKVPNEAIKTIGAGRLKGMSDINPMWRIKALTEAFGACGFGWYTEITQQWLEAGANGVVTANVKINLYVKVGDEWSKPIQGIGGAIFVAKEASGLYTSDECYKMAYTDAISVAAKALGIGADVYFNKDATKYSRPEREHITEEQAEIINNLIREKGRDSDKFCEYYKVTRYIDLTPAQYAHAIKQLEAK